MKRIGHASHLKCDPIEGFAGTHDVRHVIAGTAGAARRARLHRAQVSRQRRGARIDELAADGDHDGVAVWRRIMDVVAQLVNTTPPGPPH